METPKGWRAAESLLGLGLRLRLAWPKLMGPGRSGLQFWGGRHSADEPGDRRMVYCRREASDSTVRRLPAHVDGQRRSPAPSRGFREGQDQVAEARLPETLQIEAHPQLLGRVPLGGSPRFA